MTEYPLVWIVIGVSGSGKTTIGRLLSQWLDCDFCEGDIRHPKSNIDKMIAGKPLEDADRKIWLSEIEDDIRRSIDRKLEMVMTCSALKKTYRQQLTAPGNVQLVWVDVPEQVLKQRIEARNNHFLPSSILNSQLAAFEPITNDENIIIVDGSRSTEDVINELKSKAIQKYPSLHKSWWQRYM